MRFSCSLRLACIMVLAASLAGAAVVHKTDDTSVTGDITAIADGKLTLSAKPKPIVIGFDDIAQIVLKEPLPPPAPPPPPQPVADNNSDDSPGVFGMLFGSGRPHVHTEVAASPSPTARVSTTTRPTSQPSGAAPAAQVTLTDGDRIHAALASWVDQKITLNLPAGQSTQLPSTSVTEIWFGTLDLQKKALALTIEPGPEDVALVARDNDVVAVTGLARGISEGSLQFRYGDEDRKIGLGKMVGLLLRGNAPVPLGGFHQCIHTDNGDQFSGTLSQFDRDALTITGPSGAMKVSLPSITTIDFVNGRITCLCDLKPAKVEQTPFFDRVMPYQIDRSLTGGPLILADGTYPRGIAVHSRCVLTYDLTGDFDRFKTKLGFQQPQGLHGRVSARVLADGKVLYENPDARGDEPPIDIDVPMTGVRTLTLEIDFGKDQDAGDWVVWASPRLLRAR